MAQGATPVRLRSDPIGRWSGIDSLDRSPEPLEAEEFLFVESKDEVLPWPLAKRRCLAPFRSIPSETYPFRDHSDCSSRCDSLRAAICQGRSQLDAVHSFATPKHPEMDQIFSMTDRSSSPRTARRSLRSF